MFKKRPEVILLVYGKGGHTAQMDRFLKNQPADFHLKDFVILTNAKTQLTSSVGQYFSIEARDKHSIFKNLFIFFAYLFISTVQMMRILYNYKVVGMISTGPGMAVVPGVFCRLLRSKVIYFESWSRFSTPAIAGRVMYKVAHLFFIQHKSIQMYYPNAIYAGRL
jgi:UDP-N-acetylglucosamine:LPS N-acetylglucosamine transferase